MIAAFVISCAYFLWVQPNVIGEDIRYDIFIFWVPTIAGMIALGWYRREFLITQIVTSKSAFPKIFFIVFYLIQGLFISIVSVRQVAKMSWDLVHVIEANQAPQETLEYTVINFYRSGRGVSWAHVDFDMDGHHESFSVTDGFVRKYLDEKPHDYKVHIEAQQGLWGMYRVNSWEVLKQ